MPTSHLGWEIEFVNKLRNNLTLVIPISTLIVKVLIQIFSRDQFKEVAKSLTDFPLELMLIAMSFMLSALCGLTPNYAPKWANQANADLYATMVIAFIFFLCLAIKRGTKFLKKLFGKIFVGAKQYQELTSQPTLPNAVNMELAGRILWTSFYCVIMVPVLLFCCGVPIVTLWYVLHLIQ